MWNKRKLAQIKRVRKEWDEDLLKEALEKAPEIDIFSESDKKCLYTPEDFTGHNYLSDLAGK